MPRYSFLLFFFIISFSVHSQSVKKAYKLYEKGDLVKFVETLEKMDEKSVETSGKYYLYSLYYLIDTDNRNSIDTSFFYIKKSSDLYPDTFSKEREELEELGIIPSSIDSIISVIDSIEFDFVKEANTIKEYKKYMIDHRDSKFYGQAKKKWHTLEFEIVSNINTWQAYEEFMKNFQDSEDFTLAKTLYEELLFKEKTSDRSLFSFEKFLEDNPDTPYRDSLEQMIFNFYGLSNNTDNLKKFIVNYPESKFVVDAVNIIYHSSERNFSYIKDLDISQRLKDSISSISQIDKQNLLGIYEDKNFSFISRKGEKLITEINENFSQNVLCSFTSSDFFVIEDEMGIRIINRRLEEIYSGPKSNYIEDIGKGLIKVLYDNKIDIVHKSGKLIISDNFNDAYLVDERFILFEKDEKYSLYTFLGSKVFDFIFSDVFQEGSFILFENDQGKLYVTTSDRLQEDILNLNPTPNFLYDDYEFFEDDHMLLFSKSLEELIDSQINYIISPDSQLIEKHSFGWTASSDFGIRIVSDKISVPFTTLYDRLITSEKYFIGKRNESWEVRNINSNSLVLNNIDSIYRVTDSVLWYRDEMKEALYFSDSNEIVLEGVNNFMLLSSRYGTKKYIKIKSNQEEYIVDLKGNRLPSAEYYYSVEKGNTFSYLSEKFNISQSEIMRMNNKKNKRLLIGEKIKVRGYVPQAVISDSLFLIEFDGKKGIADIEGKIILEPEFDGITNLSKYNILLIKDEKFGNYNSSLKKLIYPKYTSLLKPIGENYYAFVNNNKYGVIDVNGKEILSNEYDKINYWNDSLVILNNDKTFSLFNLLISESIIEFEGFSYVDNDNRNFISIQTADGFGIYSKSGAEILMPVYNSIKTFKIEDSYYFLAKREISEANLIINLLVDEKGNIILNQALSFDAISQISCD